MVIFIGYLIYGEINLQTVKNKITEFIKQETVLLVAFILAVTSMFIVPPSAKYIEYIDFKVLGILLSLIIIMSALQRTEVFDKIGTALLKHTKSTRQLYSVLVLLCFFSSMLITNDVALITFVPFAIVTLKKAKLEKDIIFVLVMQTIGANLGSMLTPVGNPQNLYLYNLSNTSIFDFITLMLPYTVVSLVLILIAVCCKKSTSIKISLLTEKPSNITGSTTTQNITVNTNKAINKNTHKVIIYCVLFTLGILTVCRIMPYYILLAIVVTTVIICDRKTFAYVDYSLIFTFICFFVFIGNLGNIQPVKDFLESVVKGNEVITGVLASQAISNVPAGLMLSGFTENYSQLTIGVNLGGLGTLIASMASLISYKLYALNYNQSKCKYFAWFTIWNVGFLVILLGVHYAIT